MDNVASVATRASGRARLLVLAALAVLALAASIVVVSAPAAEAKNNCGQAFLERTGISTGRIVHSCDGGTSVMYNVDCWPGVDTQRLFYFGDNGGSYRINIACNESASVIRGFTWDFS